MKEINLTIDGKKVKAEPGMSILQAARAAEIEIPTLCHHEGLSEAASCRLCTVEVSKNGRSRLVASCVYPAEEGLSVETNTERVREIRRLILELLLPISPSGPIESLARENGVTKSRFPADVTDCSLCGLCVRYCAEVRKANAITFLGRGVNRRVALIPETARDQCFGCESCYEICPGGKIIELVDELYSASFYQIPGL